MMLRKSLVLASLQLGFSLSSSFDATAATLSTGQVTLTYNVSGRQLQLTKIQEVGDPTAFFDLEAVDVWNLTFRMGSSTFVDLKPSTLSTGTLTVLPPVGGVTTFRWLGITDLVGAGGPTVNVDVMMKAVASSKVLELDIAVTTSGSTAWGLFDVEFARVQPRSRGACATQALTYPNGEGELFPDPLHHADLRNGSGVPIEYGAFYPGRNASMQWLTYYNEAESNPAVFYFATLDGDGYYKRLTATPVATAGCNATDGLLFRCHQIPQDNYAADSYSSPYTTAIGLIRGTWYDAAKYYRAWALTANFTQLGPMRSNAIFSSRIRDAQVVGTTSIQDTSAFGAPCPAVNFNEFNNWGNTVAQAKNFFGISKWPQQVYGWDNLSFAGEYGSWYPIRPQFLANAGSIPQADGGFAPYFDTNPYFQTIPSYSNASLAFPGSAYSGSLSQFVQELMPGSQHTSGVSYCDNAGIQQLGSNALLCQATGFALDYAYGYAFDLDTQVNASGMYMDESTANEKCICYNPTHGHPIGAGKFYAQAQRSLFLALKSQMSPQDPHFYLFSECQNEYYLGTIDLTYQDLSAPSPQWNTGRNPIAAFQSVYHDYQVAGELFPMHLGDTSPAGNFSLLSNPSHMARQRYAARLSFGYAPNVGLYLGPATIQANVATFPEYAKFALMVQNYVLLMRHTHVRAFTLLGEKLRTPSYTSGSASASFLYRTKLGSEPYLYVQALRGSTAGSLGILCLNWSDGSDTVAGFVSPGAQATSITINRDDYGLAPAVYQVMETNPTTGVESRIALLNLSASNSGTINVTVGARSSRFFRLTP